MSEFRLSALTEEERREYDDMMYDAVMQADGDPYPTGEIGQRLHQSVAGKIEDGCGWAEALMEQASVKWLGNHGKRWAAAEDLIETVDGSGRSISKSARASIRRRDDDGLIVHQLQLWERMTDDELVEVIRRDVKMIAGIKIEIATAQSLLNLCREHDVRSVTDALDREGVTLQVFLDSQAAS